MVAGVVLLREGDVLDERPLSIIMEEKLKDKNPYWIRDGVSYKNTSNDGLSKIHLVEFDSNCQDNGFVIFNDKGDQCILKGVEDNDFVAIYMCCEDISRMFNIYIYSAERLKRAFLSLCCNGLAHRTIIDEEGEYGGVWIDLRHTFGLAEVVLDEDLNPIAPWGNREDTVSIFGPPALINQ